ncbi:hypothetical protein QFC21_003465 [Naganishia friedmannii]|uniref:Uncharacterized protein n=1 Tax=Naganishia friedmannii TaxID=89922 RepID=A0ACC2VRJ2_9TREE|nr:hypothetical protein QFC21_003465 [Naganishia friedmannii]
MPLLLDNDALESFTLGAPLVETNGSRSKLPHETALENATSPSNDAAIWKSDMSLDERRARRQWLSGGRGRKGLRVMIVTENFLPKVDGVTRTLARLLTHLEAQGHECMVLGPQTGMREVNLTACSRCSNIATYATLFGLPWLEPIIWKWQSYLLSK